MKANKRSLGVAVAILAATTALLVLIGSASAHKPVTFDAASALPDPKPATGPQWPALDKVDAFKKALDKAGFSLTAGTLRYEDFVKDTCDGKLPETLGNNPWPNAYLLLGFGPAEPPNDIFWQLGEDEAIVLVGQTPPKVRFFSYQTFAMRLPGSDARMGVPVGDAVNIGTIKTIGPDKFNRPIVYIITGNLETEHRVRAAALKAGYPDAIINVEAISPVIGPLGKGSQGSVFAFGHRVALADDQAELLDYAKNAPENFAVFRVTPNDRLAEELKDHPEPVPVLRIRGTGHTEMALYPSLKKLRQAILNAYAGKPDKELDTKVWTTTTPPGNRELIAEKPWVGLQRGIQVIGATRDTNYLGSFPNFRLRDGVDEFVIVYGVNHQTTGKVTYASFSIYADKDRWFGLKDGTTSSPNYDGTGKPGDSARKYLCPDDPNQCDADVQYLYAWKVARDCHGEAYCMDVKNVFEDLDGTPFACDLYDWYANPKEPPRIGPFDINNEDMFFLWRSYLEPATNVGPDDNELLYDRAIYFGPYFTQQ
jgi:hypothetical protein